MTAPAGWDVVLGLEVHAQLLTRSKIFCGCSTAFGGQPNHQVCPVCLGLPGMLPALNREVVAMAVRTGLALGCTVQPRSVFARKNYFYPDLPKGYQISQYELPICSGGQVEFTVEGADRSVRLTRIHMEEDAGKNLHGVSADGASGVDLNRAGVPLLEIVSEPELRSVDEAVEYLKSLRAVLIWLGVNDGNLEEGSFRCDANVSVKRAGTGPLGQRCEIKNMNSFRFLRQAVEYEVRRQVALLEAGGTVEQETRLFDPDRGETRAMRSKEDAHDYRYFPEPDLPPVLVDAALLEEARRALPELPRARARRWRDELGLPAAEAGQLVSEPALAAYFEEVLAAGAPGQGPAGLARQAAHWLCGDLARLANQSGLGAAAWKLRPGQLAALVALQQDGTLSGPGAKQVVEECFQSGAAPAQVVEARGLRQVSDQGAIEAAVEAVVARSPGEAERYRAGNAKLLGFFVGQVMKEMKGKGNPALVNALLKKRLDG